MQLLERIWASRGEYGELLTAPNQSSEEPSVVDVVALRKTYGDVVAVDDISFHVREGEIFGLLGPNGAGKTSTLECLEGLRQPDAGVLRVAGIDPSLARHELRRVIGVQLQQAGLPDTITAQESMKLFCAYRGVEPRYDLLDRLGLQEKLDLQYHTLSAGQQRRLVLALAVAHNPRILFLDEPTAGLDVPSRVELHQLMNELRTSGTTIILATHDMAEAEGLSDRVAILLRGRIATIGTPREITATGAGLTKVSVKTRGASLSEANTDIPAVSRATHEAGYWTYFSTDVGPTVSAIIAHVEGIGDSLIDLRVERPSLEDRFLEITSQTTGPKTP